MTQDSPSTPLRAPAAPRWAIATQYLRELRFDAPNFPAVHANIDFNATVAVTDRPLPEPGMNEVSLRLEVTARPMPDVTAWSMDVTFCARVVVENIPEQGKREILSVHVPHLMFPFVRHAISQVAGMGGNFGLPLDFVDFAGLAKESFLKGLDPASAKLLATPPASPIAQ